MSWVGGPGWGMLVLGTEEPGNLKHLLGSGICVIFQPYCKTFPLHTFSEALILCGFSQAVSTMLTLDTHLRPTGTGKSVNISLWLQKQAPEPCFSQPLEASHRSFVNVHVSSDVITLSIVDAH